MAAPDGGDGTREAPFNEWPAAQSAARDATALDAILIAGSPTIESTLILTAKASIIGGFDRTWSPDNAERPRFEPTTTFANFGVVGAWLIDARDLVIANIHVSTPDAPTGANNYGVFVEDSPTLTLLNVTADSGRGGPGSDGSAGTDGANGTDGMNGNSTADCPSDGCADYLGNVGAPGENTSCPVSNGGEGGNGAQDCSGQAGPLIIPAQAGENSGVSQGGRGGFSGSEGGLNGGDGAQIASPAQNGAGGSSSGRIEGTLWVNTGDGEPGDSGQHGDGGGGGGGSHFVAASSQSSPRRDFGQSDGNKGAGGGAGGCGGTGGEGGSSGGGSFGLFVINSAGLQVIDSNFEAQHGGVGGAGAVGGSGGDGGDGGQGSTRARRPMVDYDAQTQTCSSSASDGFRSGDGGDGADGQAGGAGGGGAGGVSYGAYCHDGKPNIQGSTTFRSLGSAQGGSSPGSPGGPGVSASEFGCF